MLEQFRISAMMLIVMSVLTGVAYPLVITGLAWVVFPKQAAGSLIDRDGKPIGSDLVGQPFDDPKYFWSRPSATGPAPYNGASSSGSNLGVSNPAQRDALAQRAQKLRESDPGNAAPIPVDLITASGSGLDPHISVAAARWQINRVARERRLDVKFVEDLVNAETKGRQFGILGEPVVNVLKLNLALDEAQRSVKR